jgi:hypothetical protein
VHESQPNILGAIMQASSHLQHFIEGVKPNSPMEEPPQLGKNLQSPEPFGPQWGCIWNSVRFLPLKLEGFKKGGLVLYNKH